MNFTVITPDKVVKEIKKLNKPERIRIFKSIEKLKDPFSLDIRKIRDDIYRVRVGRLRIIIGIDFDERIVWVLKVDWRGRVYDRM